MIQAKARPASGTTDQSSPAREPAASEHPLQTVLGPASEPVNPADLTTLPQGEMALILTSNPWLVFMRHHRDVAWDAAAEAEARWFLSRAQAYPAAPDPAAELHAAFLGLVLGVACFFCWFVFPGGW